MDRSRRRAIRRRVCPICKREYYTGHTPCEECGAKYHKCSEASCVEYVAIASGHRYCDKHLSSGHSCIFHDWYSSCGESAFSDSPFCRWHDPATSDVTCHTLGCTQPPIARGRSCLWHDIATRSSQCAHIGCTSQPDGGSRYCTFHMPRRYCKAPGCRTEVGQYIDLCSEHSNKYNVCRCGDLIPPTDKMCPRCYNNTFD